MENWETETLENCLSAIIDYRGKTPTKTSSGVPLITAKIVKNGRIETPNEFIAEKDYKAWMTRGFPKIGDVILTTEAPLGEIAQITDERIALAQRIILLRGKENFLDNSYLKYFLLSETGQSQLGSRSSGTTVLGIKQSELRKVKVTFPKFSEQRAIAKILSSLDEKIELNRQMSATLEAIAQALFKAWFVDFEPVHANLENRPSESASPDIAKLFPSEFENGIPKGWQNTTFGAAYEIFDSKRIPLSGKQREERKGIYPYYGAASIMDHVNDYLFDGIYLLLGEDGSVTKPNGTPVIQYAWGKFWVNNHAHVLQGKGEISTEHLMLAIQDENIVPFVTGAVQPKLNQGNLARIPFIKPTDNIANTFTQKIGSLFSKIRQNVNENRHLAEIRDSLLPRLISGKLPVSKIEGEAKGENE